MFIKTKIAMIVPTGALLLATILGFSAHSTTEAAKDEKKKSVKELMIAAHKAPKGKQSPLEIVQVQLKADKPNWKLIATNTKPLQALADAIKDTPVIGYRGPTKPYVNGVTSLQAAAKKQDLKKGRNAMKGIVESCASCHKPGF